jgi:threonine/homoserine/homoserine lactone efflux protein
MSLTVFVSAVLALLLAPGPTNTLMGLAGAQKGIGGVARLIPAELVGYLTAILPLAFLGAKMLERWPAVAVAFKVAAGFWVMFLAVSLWLRSNETGVRSNVSARRVYLTTMLNPKALIFGLILLPSPYDSQFLPRLGLFCSMIVGVALIWGAGGVFTQVGNAGSRRLLIVQRIASAWLAIVSITLFAGLLRA